MNELTIKKHIILTALVQNVTKRSIIKNRGERGQRVKVLKCL